MGNNILTALKSSSLPVKVSYLVSGLGQIFLFLFQRARQFGRNERSLYLFSGGQPFYSGSITQGFTDCNLHHSSISVVANENAVVFRVVYFNATPLYIHGYFERNLRETVPFKVRSLFCSPVSQFL